jgi:hypothetical protein
MKPLDPFLSIQLLELEVARSVASSAVSAELSWGQNGEAGKLDRGTDRATATVSGRIKYHNEPL